MLLLNYTPYFIKKEKSTLCRRCLTEQETDAHIFIHCPAIPGLASKRHSIILDHLGNYLQSLGYDTDIDTSPPETNTKLRSDLIIRNKAKRHTYIVDLRIPFDIMKNFEKHRLLNYEKYRQIASEIKTKTRFETSLDVLCIGVLGSWDPINNKVLAKIGLTKPQITFIAGHLISTLLKDAYVTYKAHTNNRNLKPPSWSRELNQLAINNHN